MEASLELYDLLLGPSMCIRPVLCLLKNHQIRMADSVNSTS